MNRVPVSCVPPWPAVLMLLLTSAVHAAVDPD